MSSWDCHLRPLALGSSCFLPHSTTSSNNCHYAGLYFMPLSLILPWQSHPSQAPVPVGNNKVTWVSGLSAGWQILMGTVANWRTHVLSDTKGSRSSLPENGPSGVVASSFFKKSQISVFMWHFLWRAGQRKRAKCRWTFASCLPNCNLHFRHVPHLPSSRKFTAPDA